MASDRKIKVLDLFCGAGGLSLGLELTGRFETVLAIDNWEPARNTFIANHPHLDPKNVLVENLDTFVDTDAFDQKLKECGPIDIVVGGPPCQGMSLAGKRIAHDPRNQLFNSFVTAVRKAQPKAFIMENVPGLLSMQDGKINNAIMAAFADIGYNHFDDHAPQILKAEHYGVPQIRRRLFYVGFRSDVDYRKLVWPPLQTHAGASKSDQRQIGLFDDVISDVLPTVTVHDAIGDLPPIKSGEGADEMEYSLLAPIVNEYQRFARRWPDGSTPSLYNHEAPRHTEKLISMIRQAKPGESVDPKYTDSRKWHPDFPGFTVKALGAGGGSTNRRAFHYDEATPRASSVRENARIQSFPDWYRFTGPKTHQMTQVGNAVPPLLAAAIGRSISEVL